MAKKLLLAAGILGLLVGMAVVVITLVMVATQGGRVSSDEALPFGIGGCCCSSFSLVVAIIGLVLVMKDRKKAGTDNLNPPAP